MDWDVQRRRIYEHFGLAKAGDDDSGRETVGPASASVRGAFGRSSRRGGAAQSLRNGKASFGASAMSRSVLGGSVSRNTSQTSLFTDVADKAGSAATSNGGDDPFTRTRQEKYGAKVKELNTARLQEVVYPLVQQFASVEQEANGDVCNNPPMCDATNGVRPPNISWMRMMYYGPSSVRTPKRRDLQIPVPSKNDNTLKTISTKLQPLPRASRCVSIFLRVQCLF